MSLGGTQVQQPVRAQGIQGSHECKLEPIDKKELVDACLVDA
jgi:hypothetical protein